MYRNKDALEILQIEKAKGSSVAFQDIGRLAKFDRLMEGLVSCWLVWGVIVCEA